jgi:hypothetical protein
MFNAEGRNLHRQSVQDQYNADPVQPTDWKCERLIGVGCDNRYC